MDSKRAVSVPTWIYDYIDALVSATNQPRRIGGRSFKHHFDFETFDPANQFLAFLDKNLA